MIGSYAQFAQFMGYKTKSYVNTLKKQGRLVFAGDKIDFEKCRQDKGFSSQKIQKIAIFKRIPQFIIFYI